MLHRGEPLWQHANAEELLDTRREGVRPRTAVPYSGLCGQEELVVCGRGPVSLMGWVVGRGSALLATRCGIEPKNPRSQSLYSTLAFPVV
jgi:hypothetical protein